MINLRKMKQLYICRIKVLAEQMENTHTASTLKELYRALYQSVLIIIDEENVLAFFKAVDGG